MAQTCTKCSRANPADAVYCYYDGFALGNGHGPVAVVGGQRGFQSPFVFPSGRTCRNFDELALACQDRWEEACDLLEKGYLESFLGGMGRSDLASAAKEAARFPDRQRGLDKLLDKIPSQVLEEPKLRIEPLELNLGTLRVGTDRTFDVQLDNQGMRLVYGTVTSDNCPWLTVGEGAHEKTVEFLHELSIPIKVRGDRLRAEAKPVMGRLLVETNAGGGTVVIRAEVPVTPFPSGVLAGAKTPRQIAEKARAKPKEAAALFEEGAVAKWYKDNGWVYPVQAQTSSGVAAVQQFFEALGLTPPPKVDVNKRAIRLQANIGDTLRESVELSTQDKRHVWANASSDVPWLEIGRPKLNGRSATIPLAIPSVPNKPGQVITAHVTVVGNGNQKFVIPVTLRIGESFDFGRNAVAEAPVAAVVPAREAEPFVPPPSSMPPSYRQYRRKNNSFWHAIPAALLVMLVFLIVMIDFIANAVGNKGSSKEEASWEGSSSNVIVGDGRFNITDHDPVLGIGYSKETHRFGITLVKEKLPVAKDGHLFKRLTFDESGAHNNTCCRFNGEAFLFGQIRKWMKGPREHAEEPHTWTSTMLASTDNYKVTVTQEVMLVPGDTRKLDTCLVHYTIKNERDTDVKVGLRIMIDTLIGDNDGVPFSIANHDPPLVTDLADLKDIPDYIQALEFPDLSNPGTVAHIGLRGFALPGVDVLEKPDRVVLCHWPSGEARWDWQFEPINVDPAKPDSCLVIYWPEVEMRGGEQRDMAFTYGLSAISSLEGAPKGGSQLGLYANRTVRKGDEFAVTGYVKNPKADTPVKLKVPDGLKLIGGSAEQMPGGKGDMKQVSWKVRAEENGNYDLEITHGDSKVSRKVEVKPKKSIFD
jgi:hypothetical protein